MFLYFINTNMAGVLTLNDVICMPFGCKLRDLFFVFGEGVIDWAARCVEAEVNTWASHAWYGAYHWGLPMEREMKQKLLGELSEIQYEPRHAVGAPVYIRDQVNYWPEDTRILRHTVLGSGGRKALSVVFSDRRKVLRCT